MLTGSAGYIGRHAAVVLLEMGHDVICFDNVADSRPDTALAVEQIAGKRL